MLGYTTQVLLTTCQKTLKKAFFPTTNGLGQYVPPSLFGKITGDGMQMKQESRRSEPDFGSGTPGQLVHTQTQLLAVIVKQKMI